MDKARDGFGGEINAGDAFHDDAGDLASANGNEDDVARKELLVVLWFWVVRVGEGTAVGAIDFYGHDLVKHSSIIAFR